MKENKKPHQLKKCQLCEKDVPQYFKTLTIDGVRKKVCQRCAAKQASLKKKEKITKAKVKRKEKRERITEKKLDSLVSKVIRTLYGDKCCTCPSILEYSKLHCGHFISRQLRATRFHPQNCASQCPNCNLYLQGAQHEFGKFINMFHGKGIADQLFEISKDKNIKIGQHERNELYKVYANALEHRNLDKLIQEYNILIYGS